MKKSLSGQVNSIMRSIRNAIYQVITKALLLVIRPALPLVLKYGPRLTDWLAKKTKENLPVPNLEGDREVEWSWVLSYLGSGPGEVLDFGCGNSWLSFIAAQKGYRVTAIDLQSVHWPYTLPNMRFIKTDIFKADFPKSSFDLIINW
jgi:2-polyprenyl-3-methyl-5-hydroxy-6-metoxy-1,4-benzoquinol methylase